MEKISIKGVAIGSITDIVLTNVVTFPLVIYVFISQHLVGLPPEKMTAIVTNTNPRPNRTDAGAGDRALGTQ
jgi:hypothetical protein